MVGLHRINFNFQFLDFAPIGCFGTVNEWKMHKGRSEWRKMNFSQKRNICVYEGDKCIGRPDNVWQWNLFLSWEVRHDTICVGYVCPPKIFYRIRRKTKTFSSIRVLAVLCSVLSHFGQSQFKQIFIFFSCSISTKCLFSSDKASLSQTLLLSCTGIITENCTVCSIFANWANAKLCKLFTKKEQNQTSKWACATH